MAEVKVWQGTEGGWQASVTVPDAHSTHDRIVLVGPYHGRATYEEAAEDASAFCRDVIPAAERWLKSHGGA